MRKILFALVLLSSPAMAQDKPATPAPVERKISFTENEVQVLAVSLANAGAACDAGVAIYCQVAGLRVPILAKLQDKK